MSAAPIAVQVTLDFFAADTSLPDDDITVIADIDGDLWQAYRDGDTWRDLSGLPIDASRIAYWAHMPAAPSTNNQSNPEMFTNEMETE